MNYADLAFLTIPEIILTAAALLIIIIDLKLRRRFPLRNRMFFGAALTSAACIAAIVWAGIHKEPGDFFGGMFIIDGLTGIVKPLILVMTIFTAWISIESQFTDHVGEFFALLLFATVGMLFLVSTEHLLLIFISLELLSLCLYVLTAFNKQNHRSAEAALKYFLIGSASAAFMLFGLSLLYGISGEITLSKIAAHMPAKLDPLVVLAVILVTFGFAFKVAAVPFHLWAPDAYEGAPAPSAALIASGSKLASFVILAKVAMIGFKGAEGSALWKPGWVMVLALIAALSIVIGNLAAIAQVSVRRLLAYSAIAQAGYMLVGLAANSPQGMASLIYYAITYALTALGAFGIVALVQGGATEERFSSFAGLARRAPILSACLMVFLLSLAGIPPLAGFFGKVYLFSSALNGWSNLGLLWLVILAIAMSAVSLYYYLIVLKQVYVLEAPADSPRLQIAFLPVAAIIILALAVTLLGCFPELLINGLLASIQKRGSL